MKNIFLSSFLCLCMSIIGLTGQSQTIAYQGAAVSASGQLLTNQSIALRLSILDGSASGTAVYVETQTKTTSAAGTFSVQVGAGTAVIGTFASINLMANAHYLKIEMDPAGGTNYILLSNGPISSSVVACPPNPPSAPTTASHVPSTTQIVWNWNSVADATTYKWNTVNDYASATDMGTALTKTETALTCNTAYTRYVWSFTACGHSASALVLNQSTSACPFTCGNSITVNHIAGPVAPVSKTVTYGTVSNIPGATYACWITSNLGADHQATYLQDPSEASAGWYWQYSLKQGYKHDGTNRTPNTAWISSISGPSTWQADNDPCALELGAGWRVPTNTEWHNVTSGWQWGYAWASDLKLHCAGYLDYNAAALEMRGSWGMYGSSVASNYASNYCLFFESAYTGVDGYSMADGFSVRCLK